MRTVANTVVIPGVRQDHAGRSYQIAHDVDDRGNVLRQWHKPYEESFRRFEYVPGSMFKATDMMIVHEVGQAPRVL